MRKWKDILLPLLVTLSPMAAGVVLWNRLPETMATHFDFSGVPNGYSGRGFTVFGIPLFLAAMLLVCVKLEAHEAQRLPGKIMKLVYWIIPACALLVAAQVYGYALNQKVNLGRLAFVFLGVLLAAIGNYLPKIRMNRTLGIRVPWTLASEQNWNKTHRFAAPVWVAGGLVTALAGATGWMGTTVEMALLFAVILLPIGYSYLLSRKGV